MKHLSCEDFIERLNTEIKSQTLFDVKGSYRIEKNPSLTVSAFLENYGWVNADIDLTFVYGVCTTYEEAVEMIRNIFKNEAEKRFFQRGGGRRCEPEILIRVASPEIEISHMGKATKLYLEKDEL